MFIWWVKLRVPAILLLQGQNSMSLMVGLAMPLLQNSVGTETASGECTLEGRSKILECLYPVILLDIHILLVSRPLQEGLLLLIVIRI